MTPLPSPSLFKELFPVKEKERAFLQDAKETARRILIGKDLRKVVVVGPCSIHNHSSAIEYARRFKELSLEVEPSCFLVMRVYIEKPRTVTGWKGWLYDPHLDGSDDIKTGLAWTRTLLLSLAEMGVPCATEFVDPLAASYFSELITWGFIGARTSASQPHRQFSSSLRIPIGFKNSTDGNIDHAVYGALSAQKPHSFFNIDEEGRLCSYFSRGNPLSHIVLRGAQHFVNYDLPSIRLAKQKLKEVGLATQLMIDCSHGNCEKNFQRQEEVFHFVVEEMQRGDHEIFGLMLESHLEKGNQSLKDLASIKDDVSITDPCIDWETTEDLIHSANLALSK